MTEGQDIIEYLVAHGAYVEAARLSVERGELRRAIQLYERVWRFADAVPLALAIDDRPLALRLSLDAGDTARATEIAAGIPDDARAELAQAANAFAGRGRPFEAGRAAERALDFARAAAHYRRANAALDEGRTLELAGDLHEAGLLYERLAAHGGEAESAAARLALGGLLGRLGRHHEAARMLQQASRFAATRAGAQRALVIELLTLGLRTAAAEVLGHLRREFPALPASPEAFAAAEATGGGAGAHAPHEASLLRRRFSVLKLLGVGAMGRVYLAHDTLLGQNVAVKLLAVGAGATGPERQAYFRFAREAEAAGRLRHPNIVSLHDMDEGLGLFVFELMAGGTLADRLAAQGPLSPAAGRRMALELLAALDAAHERGIIHRDIKPANVFFDAAGNAKLGDFGAAHLVDFGQTQTGGLVGTIAYMAPEQITGAGIGAAADLYALGVTLFEALTGRPPFLGPDIVAQHLGEEAPPASARRAGLSPAHDDVIGRALAKAPGERFSSAQEMAAEVRAWPTEALPGVAAPDTTGSGPTHADTGDSAGPEIELGRTAAGRLLRRRDPRVGRWIVVEERDAPLDEPALAELRAIAAAGGPHLQRVLGISDDRRSVVYEAIVVADTPANVVADTPANVVADTPANVMADTPANVVVDTPANVMADTPANVVADTPANVMADTPANVVRVDALPAPERAALVTALAGLHAPGAGELAQRPGTKAARTAGGWVVLVEPAALDSSPDPSP